MRLTKSHRYALRQQILATLPVVDFDTQILDVLRAAALPFAPEPVRPILNAPEYWPLFREIYVSVRDGNDTVWSRTVRGMYGGDDTAEGRLSVNVRGMYAEGSYKAALVKALNNSGVLARYVDYTQRRKDVEYRIRRVLDAATTVKQLYEVLEPELHTFVREIEGTKPPPVALAQLPVASRKVVDDMRLLGAALPEVQAHE